LVVPGDDPVDPDVAIAGGIWRQWLFFRRCVSGNVRRCFPFLHVLDDILVTRNRAILPEVRKLVNFRPLSRYPFLRCSPVCFGTIEVYKRICCCHPPIYIDPDDLPIDVNPDFPFPPEDPFGPIGPRPGPDPAPFELQQLVLSGGAIDEGKIAGLQARALPKTLSADLRRQFVLRYPFWWCHCGPPKKVGEGFVQDGGSFSVCWKEPPTILLPHCREGFAYIVKQPIGGVLVTVYNGLAANQWFSASDQPTRTSYHHRAIGCRDSEVPGEGAFVVLEDIGSTPSHLLATPSQTSFQSVGAPAYNSGLLNPVVNPADAIGQFLNRNLGGGVALQYHFTQSMRPTPPNGPGAIYYRIQVAKADAFGNPVDGTWTVLASMTWSTWKLNTAAPGSISLGPHSVGTEHNLSKIPYDTGDPLGLNEEWQDGQYHGIIPTTDLDNDRYLVMIEAFNAAGARLKPNSAPAAEAGTPAAFTFRRWNVPAGTVAVPFAALTHMMWWDNRNAVADIVDIRLNGTPSSEQCQFLEGDAGAAVEIGYRAYHPQPGTPSFLHTHSLVITRGLNGPSWQVANPPGAEVGEGGPPHTSVPKTLADLLDGQQKCAFAVNLHSHVKTTDGAGTLTNRTLGRRPPLRQRSSETLRAFCLAPGMSSRRWYGALA
jgi:hypothetical protein